MANINYRGNGAWGNGIGRQLTSPEIDNNFYQLNTTAQNKVFNGSAEMGTVGWLSGAVAFSSANDAVGTYFNAAAQASAITDAFVTDRFITWGGRRHDVTVDFMTAGLTGNLSVSLLYYDNGGNLISESAKLDITNSSDSYFKTYKFNDASPDNTRYAIFKIGVTGATWTMLRWRRVKVDYNVGFPTAFNMEGNWYRMLQQSFGFSNRISFNGPVRYWNSTDNTGSGASGGVSGTDSAFTMNNGTAPADQKVWDVLGKTNQLQLRLVKDDISSATPWLTITRAGMTISSINFGARPTFAGNTAWDTGNFSPANYVAKIGDDMTGPLGLSAVVGASNQLFFKRGTGKRFEIGMDATAEGAGDTGSAFYLSSYDNNGAFKSKLLNISRDTGRLDYAGNLWVSRAAIDTGLYINANAGFNRLLNFATAGSTRWQLLANSVAETGNNAGSNFAISRCSDAGVFIDNPLVINRQNGQTVFTHNIAIDTVGQGTAESPVLSFNGVKKTARGIFFNTSGRTRWDMLANASDETGSNSGTDFAISRYNDQGQWVDAPFFIYRSTGLASFTRRPFFAGQTPWDTGNLNPTINWVSGGNEADLNVNVAEARLTGDFVAGPKGYVYVNSTVQFNTQVAGTLELIAFIRLIDVSSGAVVADSIAFVQSITSNQGGLWAGAILGPCFMRAGLTPGVTYRINLMVYKNQPIGPIYPRNMYIQWMTM